MTDITFQVEEKDYGQDNLRDEITIVIDKNKSMFNWLFKKSITIKITGVTKSFPDCTVESKSYHLTSCNFGTHILVGTGILNWLKNMQESLSPSDIKYQVDQFNEIKDILTPQDNSK
jgi:hypothetical protein